MIIVFFLNCNVCLLFCCNKLYLLLIYYFGVFNIPTNNLNDSSTLYLLKLLNALNWIQHVFFSTNDFIPVSGLVISSASSS